MLAKHTKNFDLTEAISLGVDRIQRGIDPIRRTSENKRQLKFTDGNAVSDLSSLHEPQTSGKTHADS